MSVMKRLVLVALLLSLSIAAFGASRDKRIKYITVPVYDTVRVVVTVTDTIRVEPKPAPRIDTLRTNISPRRAIRVSSVHTQRQRKGRPQWR